MSHFTTAETVRRDAAPYRPPTMEADRDRRRDPGPPRQADLLGDDAPAAAMASSPARPRHAPSPRPAPARASGVAAIRVDGRLYEIRIVDDPGNEFTGPIRIFDFVPLDRPGDVDARVCDYARKGPQCWCRGLPHRRCPHVRVLSDEGYIESTRDLDARWGLGPDGGEGGEP